MRHYDLILPTMMVTLCILGLTSPAQGQPPTCKIVVDPEAQDVTVCNEFTIDIWITELSEPMTGFSFQVNWDGDLMELMGSEEHCSAHVWGPCFSLDAVNYYRLIASGDPLSITSSWVTLTFHCKGEGSSDIVITNYYVTTEEPEFVVTVEGGTVSQHGAVGGFYATVNKLGILTPYLALVGLIGVASALAIRKWRRS